MKQGFLLLLLQIGYVLSLEVIDDPDVNTCGVKPVDVVFILDESSSIYFRDFATQKQFVKDVVSIFEIESGSIRVGVMTFADKPLIRFNLGTVSNVLDFQAKMNKINQTTGNTYTADAIDLAVTDMYGNHGRTGVPKIIILITDGESENIDRTAAAAKRARDSGITIFAIGVGQNLKTELNLIASPPLEDHVHTADNYTALEKIIATLAYKSCIVTTPEPPTTTTLPQMIEGCSGRQKMDIIFALPDQAGVAQTEHCVEFISSIVAGFRVAPDLVRVGVTPKFCSSFASVKLNEQDTSEGIVMALDERRNKNTHTDRHLTYIHSKGFLQTRGARSDAVSISVLIVDNISEDPSLTQEKAQLARDAGIKVIVIGVGQQVDASDLLAIAGDEQSVFFIDSFSDIQDLSGDIIQLLCQELGGDPVEEEYPNYYDFPH